MLRKTKFRSVILAAAFGFTIGLATASTAPAESLINGAGATFPFPLYSKWFSEYQTVDAAVKINYQSIGSGGGIRQFLAGTVDFGASDAPMTDEQIAKAKAGVFHIPAAMGAVVLTYNVPGIEKGLQLTPELVADLFTGNVTTWNDARLAKANPGVKLPATPIVVAYRSDGSGTTAIFTDYLAKISSAWKEEVGVGPSVKFPVGLGGKGNEGVTGLVKQTPGSIGYVELIYAKHNNLSYATLQNKAGRYIVPSLQSITAAADSSLQLIPEDFRVSITNSEGKDAYPISGFTYLLISGTMPKEKGQKIVSFLKWAVRDGQKLAETLTYAPLPKELVKRVEAKIGQIRLQ